MANGGVLFIGVAVIGGGLLLVAMAKDKEEEHENEEFFTDLGFVPVLPFAQLPPDVVDALSGFFQRDLLERVDIEVEVPGRAMVTCTPSAGATIKVGSNPAPREIVIHPDFYNTRTADGLALIGHEIFHVVQREENPAFEQQFVDAAIETERQGLSPWDNPFEIEAYAFEKQIRAALMRRGFPQGSLAEVQRIMVLVE